jgi:hypothetical protein
MFYLKSENADFGINIPTDIKEIDAKVLEDLTKHVSISPYYVILGLALQTKLALVAINIQGKKDPTVKVIPLVAKFNLPEGKDGATAPSIIKVGQRAIVSSTDIERGIHLNIPSYISHNVISKYVADGGALGSQLARKDYMGNMSRGKTIDMATITPEIVKADNDVSIYMLEFKIVPYSAIVGAIDDSVKIPNVFITANKPSKK